MPLRNDARLKAPASRPSTGFLLEALSAAWYRGERVELPEALADREDAQAFINDILAVQELVGDLSKGKLAGTIKAKGIMAGSARSLQASLRHLVWQTERVAAGDFLQRVDFLGEFSEHFNAMIIELDANRRVLSARNDELDKALAFIDMVVKTLPGIFYVYDSRGNLIRCNQRLVDLIGRDPSREKGHHFDSVLDPGCLEAVNRAFSRTCKGEKEVEVEACIRAADGQRPVYRCTGSPFVIGGETYIVGFGIDVTEELSVKAELERAKRLLESRVLEQVREITDARMATIFAMAKLSESRDEDTGRHLERTQQFCEILAGVLCSDPRFSAAVDETFMEALRSASPLHDIGKVAIPDSVLLKPARLEVEEFAIMKAHTVLGALTLESVRGKYPGNFFIDMGVDIARSHHERWDGQGYPDGLSGLGIPLPARIMAVADVYDALRSRRCYKPALGHDESVRIIAEQAGRAFDPMIAQALVDHSARFDQVWLRLQD